MQIMTNFYICDDRITVAHVAELAIKLLLTSEAILLGTRQLAHSYSNIATINVAGCEIPLGDYIKILGVTLDKTYPCTTTPILLINLFTTISVHYGISVPPYMKTLLKWLPVCSLALASTMPTLFYMALPTKTFLKYRKQNLCAHVLTSSLQPSLYTLLQQLHWLPTEYCINFTIADITFHTLHSFQPAYLYSALHAHRSTCSLRWSNNNLVSVPFLRTSFGTCSFGIAAPKIWNSLSPAFQMCTSPNTFHNRLKTHYFQ